VAALFSIQAAFAAFLPKGNGTDLGNRTDVLCWPERSCCCGGQSAWRFADRYGIRAATIWPLVIKHPKPVWYACGHRQRSLDVRSLDLVGGRHGVLVVHAQRLIPARQGFAAGLILPRSRLEQSASGLVARRRLLGINESDASTNAARVAGSSVGLDAPSHERRMPIVAPALPISDVEQSYASCCRGLRVAHHDAAALFAASLLVPW